MNIIFTPHILAAIGMGTGILFGMSSVAVGHPFDTIKTKMQSETQYLGNDKPNAITSFIRVVRQQGIRGLYSGCWPPLFGSGVYRATQFMVYEGMYTKFSSEPSLCEPIPYTDGMQLRVLISGALASTARAIVECPIEYAKTNRQVSQQWYMNQLYTGFTAQWTRTSIVMVTYFIAMDNIKRNHTTMFNTNFGAFLASAGSATFGFILAWPFELLKNQIQANTPIPSAVNPLHATTTERIKYVVSQYGIQGLYRGILPGVMRSFISNGTAMVVMKYANKKVSEWGLRD